MRLRTERLKWREVDGEIVALDLESDSYFNANATASALLKRLASGDASVDDLVETLVANFDVDKQAARVDVQRFLADLEEDGLLDTEA